MIVIKIEDSEHCLNSCTIRTNPNDSSKIDLCDSNSNVIRTCDNLNEVIQTAETISVYLKYQLAKSQEESPNYNRSIEEAARTYFNKQYPGIEDASTKYQEIFTKYVNNVKNRSHDNPTAMMDTLVVEEFEKLEEETI